MQLQHIQMNLVGPTSILSDDIENKFLWVAAHREGPGRGGNPDYHVYAVLDWGPSKRYRKQAFYVIAQNHQMQDLIHRVDVQHNGRLYQQTMEEALGRLSGAVRHQYEADANLLGYDLASGNPL